MGYQLLTIKQAAKLANVSYGTMYHMISDGRIPCLRFGSAIRIKPEAIGMNLSEETKPSIEETAKVKAESPKGLSFLDSIRPELERAFQNIPEYGDVGFKIVFHEKKMVRIEYTSSILVKLVSDAESKLEPTRAPKRI